MRYDVTHHRKTYTVVDDRTVVTVAAVTGRLVDETTGAGIRAPAVLRVRHPAMRGRVVDGGRFAVSALPEVDLPLLATDAYDVEASASAPAFVDLETTFTLPAGTALPVDAGDLTLRRRPVRVRGRVTHHVTGLAVQDALVFASAPLAAQQLLALRWPLRFDHPAGTEVRRRRLDLTAVATTLTGDVRGGGRTLPLASRTGLAVGGVLRLGTPPAVEIAVVGSLAPEPADPAQPGEVDLTAGLHRGFAAGAPVRLLDPDAVPQTRALTVAAHAGDGLLLLDGAIAPDTIDTVEVRDADPARVEYHVLGATTDDDGFYRLDGIGRVAEVRLVARAAGLADGARTVALDYGSPTNAVNFRLEP